MKRILLTNQNTKQVIDQAVQALKSGQLIIFPTETCYGLGVDATNQSAVDQALAYKSRREGKPLSVAVSDIQMAQKYVVINDIAQNIYTNYLPGPITVVSKYRGGLADGIASEYNTLGIRVPAYELILQLVKEYGKPITSTSANVSYMPTPYNIDKLLEELPEKQKSMIGLIIDAGELPKNPPSTVVDTTLNNLNVMRAGTVKFNEGLDDKNVVLSANTATAEETQDLGSMVLLKYIDVVEKAPLILALKGDLGAGKTQFVKGIGRGLKIKDLISSPTFTIVDEYDYSLNQRAGKLYHMDTWRVDGSEELDRLGLDQYLQPGNVIAIEWADKFFVELEQYAKKFSGKMLKVDFRYTSQTSRDIKVYEE
ncbi:MAG: hypothetical protein Fur003_6010 [Candidatus Dojkabacteria bacterium]